MSMKKLSALILLLAAASLVSCDGKEKGNGGNENEKPATATVSYRFDAGADFLTLFNVEASYTDAAGQTASEKVTSLPWEKSLEGVSLPYTSTLTMTLEPVDSYAQKETYEVGYGFAISYRTSDGRLYGDTSVSKMTIGKDKVEKYRETILSRNLTSQVEIPLKSE